jgi:hypothetical protein
MNINIKIQENINFFENIAYDTACESLRRPPIGHTSQVKAHMEEKTEKSFDAQGGGS